MSTPVDAEGGSRPSRTRNGRPSCSLPYRWTIARPDRPGLGVDLDEEAIERYPPHGNAIPVEEDPDYDYQYVAAHRRRAAWLAG